ncbi:MAG: tautomerase [Alphaproteobacteria bacterium]
MPYLQFDVNKKLDGKIKEKFINFIQIKFSEIMETGTSHIAVCIKEFPKNGLALGLKKKTHFVCFMNLDVRGGRSNKKKRDLVKCYMKAITKYFGISQENQYLTFTSHPGNDFNTYEKPLGKWVKNDSPLD